MSNSDIIQIISIVCTSFLSIIAIIISILTLRQNNKIIFESNKPNLSIFAKVFNFSSPHLYLVLKNFGNSGATIININYDNELNSYFEKQPFKNMNNVFIAPNQSFVYALDNDKNLDDVINYEIEYQYLNKTYKEKNVVSFRHYKDIAFTKIHSSKDEKEISDVLQEMIIQNV